MSENADVICPYYKGDKVHHLYCELATFRFPDVESKGQIMQTCCSMRGHKECPLYKTLTAYYERKYKEGD